MMWEGIDQRKFPRVSYNCRIKVSRIEGEEIIDAETENIGIGGICVLVNRKLELFETVSLVLRLDGDDNPIECDGTVCWVVGRHPSGPCEEEAYDVGIEFQDITDQDRSRVEMLVKDILGRQT